MLQSMLLTHTVAKWQKVGFSKCKGLWVFHRTECPLHMACTAWIWGRETAIDAESGESAVLTSHHATLADVVVGMDTLGDVTVWVHIAGLYLRA